MILPLSILTAVLTALVAGIALWRKKPVLWALLIVPAALGVLLALNMTKAKANAENIEKFTQAFDTMTHPAGTEKVFAFSNTGDFGEGHHCEYFAGELRKSTLDASKLRSAYAASTAKWRPDLSYLTVSQKKINIVTAEKLAETLPYVPFDNFAPAWQSEMNKDDLYLVYVSVLEDLPCDNVLPL